MKITIRADEGKWLTDGENYGKTMSLAEGVDVSTYFEISDEEYDRIMAEAEAEAKGVLSERGEI